MRTKTLVCAAVLAASIATTMAQSNVYSLNVVGYYNITVASHAKVMIANQLNTTNNSILALLAPPAVGDNDQVFKYGGGFTAQTYNLGDGDWEPDDTVSMNPGEALFFFNAQGTTETITFVGEVLQGSLTNSLPLGTKVMRSSIVPQQGLLTTDLQVPAEDLDTVYTYDSGYSANTYNAGDGAWEPFEPLLNVGQGFFYLKYNGGSTPQWIRNFTVQ